MGPGWKGAVSLLLAASLLSGCAAGDAPGRGRQARSIRKPGAARAEKRLDVQWSPSPLKTAMDAAGPLERAYAEILLDPEKYGAYYAVEEHIPSDDGDMRMEWYYDGTQPYMFAVHDMDGDGTAELLLGYGLIYSNPLVLLNILRYDEAAGGIVDVDGPRTYPLRDALYFYENGYFATQILAGGLFLECWRLEDDPDHYWYGYERTGDFEKPRAFYDMDGTEISAREYDEMTGAPIVGITWHEATGANVLAEVLRGE